MGGFLGEVGESQERGKGGQERGKWESKGEVGERVRGSGEREMGEFLGEVGESHGPNLKG